MLGIGVAYCSQYQQGRKIGRSFVWASYLHHVADLESEHVRGNVAVGVDLDHQIKVTLTNAVPSVPKEVENQQKRSRGGRR